MSKASGDWLAVRDLATAGGEAKDAICFHCQQYVEKLLKALLVQTGRPAGRVHDLIALLENLVETFPELNVHREKLAALSRFAVEVRYPEEFYEATAEDVRDAVAVAEKVGSLCLERLETKSDPADTSERTA